MPLQIKALNLKLFKNIVVLTGAGISVASGLRTYRGRNGIWEEGDVARLSHADALRNQPDEAWQFYSQLRQAVLGVGPNPAHQALADLETRLDSDQKLVLITQNVDGLHQKAGSNLVIEMHGAIYRTRCSNDRCEKVPYLDETLYESTPVCLVCRANLRPDIVLFGEVIPADSDWAIRRAFRNCDLFMAVGTSGTVHPACDLVRSAKYGGAHTILVNPDAVPSQDSFDVHINAGAEEALPRLFGCVPGADT